MASLILSGSTSGSITVSSPAVSGSNTQTLPAVSGTILVQGTASNIVSGTAVASTSGTSIDFTGIPSWVKRITVMFNGVSTNGTSNMLVQIGDSGGFETSNYAGASSFGGAGATAHYSSGFIVNNNILAAEPHSGFFSISSIGSNAWAGGGVVAPSATNGPCFSGGAKTLSGTLTQVRVTTVNGTDAFDAGTINILYE